MQGFASPAAKLDKVFQPIRLGNVQLKNRIVMPPMATGFTTERGHISQRGIDYYAARAAGGAGLIIVEAAHVHKHGIVGPELPNIFHDRYIPGLKMLADAIHRGGSGAAQQLIFVGTPRYTGTNLLPAPFAFSPKTRELHPYEMEAIVAAYAEAARRAQEAGFDMVELHACHGSLLSMFLSPYCNRRTDAAGGTEGGARFVLGIVRSIKERTNGSLVVGVRINGDDGLGDRGTTIYEAKTVARVLAQGADVLHISSGLESRDPATVFGSPSLEPGYRLHLSAGVKSVVAVPVIASGAIVDLSLAEDALNRNYADLVALGRPLIADPSLPAKSHAGHPDDVRPCTRCMTCVERRIGGRLGEITCMGNAAVGRERDLALVPAPVAKKVVVVGGGPGGMEAARVAALRGHRVVLYEREPELGGQLRLAAIPPEKRELSKLVRYLGDQLKKLEVRVELGKAATIETVNAEEADVVIIATGATAMTPDFARSTTVNVLTADNVLTGQDLPDGPIIVVGGMRVGCETADFLASHAKQVTLIAVADEPAWDVDSIHRKRLLERLDQHSVNIVTGRRVVGIDENGVRVRNGVFGIPPEEHIAARAIVFATGAEPRSQLSRDLANQGLTVYSVGDCVEPRTVLDAIHEGYRTARLL